MKRLPKKFLIHIHSEEQSILVQERLFELGINWYGRKEINYDLFQKSQENLMFSVEIKQIGWCNKEWYLEEAPEHYTEFVVIPANHLFD